MVALLAALSATAASDGTAVGQPDRPGAGTALPDSVLAMVGERALTRASYLRARGRETTRSEPSTPDETRRFLDLLVDRELLIAGATPDPAPWTAADSARYEALRDRLTLATALDSALAMARAWTGSSDPETLGIAARDSTISRMGTVFDPAVLERVAQAFSALPRPTSDSSLTAQIRMISALPEIAPADSAAVLARSEAGDYRVTDLLDAWGRLSPAYRPRIERADEVRDLVANGLYERALRRAAAGGGFERRPDVAAALTAAREEIAATHLVQREVLDRVLVADSTLRARYEADPGAWTLPARVRLLRLELPDRTAAGRMAAQLRDPAWAETLEARARARGVSYEVDVTAASDSALYAEALGAGTGVVLGPDAAGDEWRVVRVEAILPARPRGFDEVRGRIEALWVQEETERLTQALLDRLRARFRVARNEAAIERLARGTP